MLDLRTYMDYLTHEVEADDWRAEVKDMICVTPNGNIDMAVLVFDSCLENPELSKWRDAFVWRLVEQFGDDACVIQRQHSENVIGN